MYRRTSIEVPAMTVKFRPKGKGRAKPPRKAELTLEEWKRRRSGEKPEKPADKSATKQENRKRK
jgi:hypothetical protein